MNLPKDLENIVIGYLHNTKWYCKSLKEAVEKLDNFYYEHERSSIYNRNRNVVEYKIFGVYGDYSISNIIVELKNFIEVEKFADEHIFDYVCYIYIECTTNYNRHYSQFIYSANQVPPTNHWNCD